MVASTCRMRCDLCVTGSCIAGLGKLGCVLRLPAILLSAFHDKRDHFTGLKDSGFTKKC